RWLKDLGPAALPPPSWPQSRLPETGEMSCRVAPSSPISCTASGLPSGRLSKPLQSRANPHRTRATPRWPAQRGPAQSSEAADLFAVQPVVGFRLRSVGVGRVGTRVRVVSAAHATADGAE